MKRILSALLLLSMVAFGQEKISQLPTITTPGNADAIPLVHSGTTSTVTFQNLQSTLLTGLTAGQIGSVPSGVIKGNGGAFSAATSGTDFLAPGTVVATHASGLATSYTPNSNNNTSRGANLVSAVGAATTAGDTIFVGGGSYDIGTSVLTMTANTSIVMSPSTVVLTSAVLGTNGCAIKPASGCVISGGTIQSNAASGVYNAQLGINTAATTPQSGEFTGVQVWSTSFIGDSDNFYVTDDSANSIQFYNCNFTTKWDSVVSFAKTPPANNGSAIDLFECTVLATGPTTMAGNNITRGPTCGSGKIRVFGGHIIATGSGSPTDVSGAETSSVGTIDLYNVRIESSGSNSQDVHNSAGTLNATNGTGSGTNGAYTTSGTLTYFNSGFLNNALSGFYQPLNASLTTIANNASTSFDAHNVTAQFGTVSQGGVATPTISSTSTLTNKTISGASNTLTVRAASDITGTLQTGNGGTGLTAFAAGTQYLAPSGSGSALTGITSAQITQTTNAQTGTSYTAASGDNGAIVHFTNSGSITVTLPNNLATGWTCTFVQEGAGQVTFVPASGATINNRQSQLKTAGQYGSVSATVYTDSGTNAVYVLWGDTSS